tara:strand:+ start:5543 stop:5797 length:255 start_codon:yes stop_codon:yes gene_type:complete
MHSDMYGGYFGWIWLLWLGFIFIMFSNFGVWGYTYRVHRNFRNQFGKQAVDILNERYAHGDITREQYAQQKDDILSSQIDPAGL